MAQGLAVSPAGLGVRYVRGNHGSDLDCYYGQNRTLTADVTYNW